MHATSPHNSGGQALDKFEFVFTLFGLVMGLALTELLGGFARAVKRHGPAKLGVLTPLICLFLTYEITDFWMNAWGVRELVPIEIATLLVCVVITGLYYFATVLVWPEDGDAGWDDLDGWMLAHKKQLMLSVFASNAVTLGGLFALGALGPQVGWLLACWIAVYFAAILVAAFAPGRRIILTAICLLLTMHAAALIADIVG